jgi:hypothetical protein
MFVPVDRVSSARFLSMTRLQQRSALEPSPQARAFGLGRAEARSWAGEGTWAGACER